MNCFSKIDPLCLSTYGIGSFIWQKKLGYNRVLFVYETHLLTLGCAKPSSMNMRAPISPKSALVVAESPLIALTWTSSRRNIKPLEVGHQLMEAENVKN